MNVIVSNKYTAMLSNLSQKIDLIKTIDGEFQVEDLINQFQNFFFNKMILDITAIKDYQDISQIQRLSFGLDMSKVILLLDDSPVVNSQQYLSELVSMGIYNFTRNIDAIVYLIDNPNSYKDVANFHMLGNNQNMGGNMMPQGNFNGMNNNMPMNNPQGQFINPNMMNVQMPTMGGTRVIGIKNLTEHAGATTLIYMLKKQLSEFYSVLALELDKDDFKYFGDSEMRSIASQELQAYVNNPVNSFNVILVDINNSPEEANCSEMLYLVEPSTIKLNKMIASDNMILNKMKNVKVVLNKSMLDANDVRDFENEANCRVFFNIKPLDEKKDKHTILDEFLNMLGFDKNKPEGEDNRTARLFGIVKE